MLDIITSGLKCDFCEEGILYFSRIDTIDDYSMPYALKLETTDENKVIFDEIIDKQFAQYTVFKCNFCKTIVKITFKEMEKRIREKLYKEAVMKMAADGFRSIDAINFVDKVFIYCGKCMGLTGKGACPIKVFENCKLKRLPI